MTRSLPRAVSSQLARMLASIFDVLHQALRADLRPVDVALGIGGDAFRRAGAGGLLHRIGNERRHRAVPGAADPDPALPAVMVLGNRFRFGIRHIEDVVLVDEEPARAAELRPLVDEIAVLVEDLDAVVVAVAEE